MKTNENDEQNQIQGSTRIQTITIKKTNEFTVQFKSRQQVNSKWLTEQRP